MLGTLAVHKGMNSREHIRDHSRHLRSALRNGKVTFDEMMEPFFFGTNKTQWSLHRNGIV